MAFDYTEVSKSYDRYRSFDDGQIDQIIDFAGIKEGARILDMGCGTGNAAFQLMKSIKAAVIGIDKSIQMLQVARSKSIEVVCADIDNVRLPVRDRYFDYVIGTYVIHHISNPGYLFSECYRILDEGTLVILTSSHEQIEHQHPVIRDFFPGLIDIDKSRFPDIPKIDNLLDAAGFSDIEHREIRIEDIPIDGGYLEKVKAKYVSTYHLLPAEEFKGGVEKLETYINNISRPEFREWRGTLVRGRKAGG